MLRNDATALAVVIDASTVAVLSGKGGVVETSLDDLSLTETTDVAIVSCETVNIMSASQATLDRKVHEQIGEGTVYCYQALNGPEYQVFSIHEALLQKLRDTGKVGAVIPYGIAIRDGLRSSEANVIDRISRAIMVRARRATSSGKAEEKKSDESIVVIDVLANRAIVTAMVGPEVKAVRVLYPGDDLNRELFVTLQGSGMPESRLISPSPQIIDLLRKAGQEVEQVRVPRDMPGIGWLGLTKPTEETRFYLPRETARIRARAARKVILRSLMRTGGVFIMAAGLAAVAGIRALTAKLDLDRLEKQRTVVEAQLEDLFRNRYASTLSERFFDLPQAWAELAFMMPPQLEVRKVRVTPGLIEAELVRRVPEGGADPPLAMRELKAAVERSASWRGAKVDLRLTAHALKYVLEKRR